MIITMNSYGKQAKMNKIPLPKFKFKFKLILLWILCMIRYSIPRK